jgi:hypothetical protein
MKKLSQMSSEESEMATTKRALRKSDSQVSALQGALSANHAELARIKMLVKQLSIDELTEWANE